jgi:hypothetical protein
MPVTQSTSGSRAAVRDEPGHRLPGLRRAKSGFPDAFYTSPPAYAFDTSIGNLNSEAERR